MQNEDLRSPVRLSVEPPSPPSSEGAHIPWKPCPPSRGNHAHLPVESAPTMVWNPHRAGETGFRQAQRRQRYCGSTVVFLQVDRRLFLCPSWRGTGRAAARMGTRRSSPRSPKGDTHLAGSSLRREVFVSDRIARRAPWRSRTGSQRPRAPVSRFPANDCDQGIGGPRPIAMITTFTP